MDAREPIIELQGVTKQFAAVRALDCVDLQIFPGEIHALMGENGAGKSSLIKVLTGFYASDRGEILLRSKPIHPKSPADAATLGVSTVYQEINLAPNLTVAENISLGREPMGPFGIRWNVVDQNARKALSRVGLNTDPRLRLGSCSLAAQQMVAIARALDIEAHTLILDEPTSSLDKAEVEQLFALMRRLRDQGLAILFVTHFLDQVYAVSDRITVLRNGRRVGSWSVEDLPRLRLVSEMIGRDAASLDHAKVRKNQELNPEISVAANGVGSNGSVEGVTFALHKGSTLGLAGLLGSGRTETLRLLFGIDKVHRGSLAFHSPNSPKPTGNVESRLTPRRAIRFGIGYTSEDRKVEGILPELSVRENLILALQAKQGWLRRIGPARQRLLVDEMVRRLGINLAHTEIPIEFLSGGNQQKVLLARWLIANPQVLLLDEPTRGIDVGAKFEILALIESLKEGGMSFVFVSSDLSELVAVSDSVLVYRDRKMIGILTGEQIGDSAIVHAIAESPV